MESGMKVGERKPLHPLFVFIRFQNRLWSYVDHQRSSVLRPSCLVSEKGKQIEIKYKHISEDISHF